MAITFEKATRSKAKARLALAGPSGTGKTYSSLLLAKGLGGKIAVVDTENGSASLYAGLEEMPEFDTMNLNAPYSPERYVEVIKAAEKAGYDILIIDSASHEWSGTGGCLEINDKYARAKMKGNTFMAWSHTTPRHNLFVNAILQSSMHIILTVRTKAEFAQNDVNGRKVIEKIGTKKTQREDFEFEFTCVLDLNMDNVAVQTKDRTGLFRDPEKITVETGKRLLEWLNQGEEAPVSFSAPEPQPEVNTSEKPVAKPKAEKKPAPKEDTPTDLDGWKKLANTCKNKIHLQNWRKKYGTSIRDTLTSGEDQTALKNHLEQLAGLFADKMFICSENGQMTDDDCKKNCAKYAECMLPEKR